MNPIVKKTSDIVDELLSAIQQAEHEIFFQTFYFDNDEIGKSFIKALAHKASHGVKVHCLFDALGARDLSGSREEKNATTAGVHIEYFNWLTPWSFKNKRSWFFRNHKRSLIIDNKIVYMGGWCIGNKTQNWIDANLPITNEHVIHRAVADFKNMLRYAKRRSIRFHHEKKFSYSLDPLHTHQYAYQAPLLRARHIYYTYLKLLKSATRSITLIAPYFVPGRQFVSEILRAKRKGVEVDIYLPQNTDYRTVDIAARTYFTKLLKQGVRIHLCRDMLHAKVSILDDTVFIGSLNLDNISLRYNFENGVFVRDDITVETVKKDIAKLHENSETVKYAEWLNRSLWDKFLEKIVGVFKGVL